MQNGHVGQGQSNTTNLPDPAQREHRDSRGSRTSEVRFPLNRLEF